MTGLRRVTLNTLALVWCILAARLGAQAATFSVLHEFSFPGDYGLNGPLAQAPDGTLYGTTLTGGPTSAGGTIFKVDTNGVLTALYVFSPEMNGTNSDGYYPSAGLLLAGNTLYGTTELGGTNGGGTVFAIDTGGGGLTNLYNFPAGSDPRFGLVLSGNTLYGTTEYGGGPGNGTVFAVKADGTGFGNLHTFSLGSDETPADSNFPIYTNSDGVNPNGLILSGDTLYGTTYQGGTNGIGTVFAIDTGSTGFTILHTFNAPQFENRFTTDFTNSDGGKPYAGLVLSGNALYGTTGLGGSNGYGTVFSVRTDGADFAPLYSFGDGSDGAYPQAGLSLSGDTLYGTTVLGGANDDGTVFSVTTNGTGFTPLYSFVASGAGAGPVILSGSTLYGTTSAGVIYKIDATGAGYTNFYSFQNSDGAGPAASLILSGNTLYGTASQGGINGNGTVFAVNISSGGFTNLYSFTGGNDGGEPEAGLVLSGNTLYGTASEGGANGSGAVFAVNADSTGFTNLHSFTGSDGANPVAGLVLSDGTLIGTAQQSGPHNNGTIFAVGANGGDFTNLYNFTGGNDGAYPYDALLPAGGRFYGTANGGGSNGYGTVFSVNTNGTGFTTLYTFTNGADGADPQAGLVLSGDTLYGTARYVGPGHGTVFSVNTNGTGFTTLYAFTNGSDGADPLGGLVLSGYTLYGTAAEGGTNGSGTVFAVNTDGTGFATLYTFTNGNDGAYPAAGLILAGNTLYGTALSGGANGAGTVFSLSLALGPPLSISVSGTNVVVTWPASAAAYTLESTTNLASPAAWSLVSPGPVVVGVQNVVTDNITGTQQFFRLQSN